MKLHRPRASQVSVAHHLHYKSCRVKMQEFSCGQYVEKLDFIRVQSIPHKPIDAVCYLLFVYQ